MGLNHLFHLGGRDVLAAPAHHVFAPAHKVQVALGVLAQQVTGVEPQVAKGLQTDLGHAVVAGHQQAWLQRADHQLASGARRQREAVLVLQLHLKRADGPAAAARAARLVERGVDHHPGFGGAVELHQPAAKACLELGRPGR